MITRKRKVRYAAAAALGLPVFLLCAPWLLSAKCLHGIDFASTYRPLVVLARENLAKEGELPRWNPYQYAGTPFLGNGQWSPYYPPNLLFLAMAPEEAFEIFVFLHLLLAAFGSYRLARAFRISRAGSVLAGITWALSFGLVARVYAGHLTIVATLSQAPLVLHLLKRTLERPSRLHQVLLAVWTALVVVSGHPQYVYHLALLSLALVAWKLVERRKTGWAKSAFAAAGAGVLALLLSAAHLLPALEVSAQSTRGGADPYEGQHGIPPHETLLWHNLLSLVLPSSLWNPKISGPVEIGFWHEKALYGGLLPLALVPFAAVVKPRGPVLFFAIAGLIALLDAMALVFPVHDLLSLLPGFATFRVPPRVLWVTGLGLPLLAGFGWDSAARFVLARKPLAPRIQAAMAAGAVALAALDLLVLGLGRLRSIPREAYAAPPWYAKHIGEKERAEYRVLDLTRVEAEPAAHGFRLLRGCGYPIPAGIAWFYAQAWEAYTGPITNSLAVGTGLVDVGPLRDLNVRWIVSRGPPLHPDWKTVAREGDLVLYEDPGARPPAFLVEGGYMPAGEPKGTTQYRRLGANRIRVDFTTDRSAFLVVSEADARGWRRFVDGTPRGEQYQALITVSVGPDEKTLDLIYDPIFAKRGLQISAFGAFAFLLFLPLPLKRLWRKDDKNQNAG